MAYEVLYRKYRPKSFSEVVGQEPIRLTLSSQILEGKPSHAYLFCGSRGTGKTSFARIFAKAVNCLSPKKGLPCNACTACKELDNPTNLDILEIDAASNNKVEEVRELKERIKFLPVIGKYKVYIIDEVHMLTDSAFNALLKTLEEPPAHIIFILATTEVHKLPSTIRSRCIRFDFRLACPIELKQLLERVLEKEKIECDEDAKGHLIKAADGSFRDLLSLLDLSKNYAKGKITIQKVLEALGASDIEEIEAVLFNIFNKSIAQTLVSIDNIYKSGKSMARLAKDISGAARDFLCIKSGVSSLASINSKNAKNYTEEFLVTVLEEFSKIDQDLRYAVNPRIVLETAALSIIFNSQGTIRNAQLSETATSEPQPVKSIAPANNSEKQISIDAPTLWGKLTTYFRRKKDTSLTTLFSSQEKYSIKNGELKITADSDNYLLFSDNGTIKKITEALEELGFNNIKIIVEKQRSKIDIDKEIVKLEQKLGEKPKVIKK